MTDPEGNRETYAYDAGDRLCRKRDRNGTETTYTYNLYDNLLERKAKKISDTSASLSERYEYTPEGLLKSAVSNSVSEGIPTGMQYTYTYDSMDRLMEKKASGRTLLSFTYDLNGNLTSQKDVTGKITEYRYDLIDRVSEVWDNGNKVAEYGYNPNGTIKSLRCGSLYTEYAYDGDRNLTGLKTMLGNEILADNHYRYDGNGNRTEKKQLQGTTTYAYDAIKRLQRVEYPGRKEELFYDKAGNRTKRVCNGMEELYRYDKRNRLTTYTKGGVNTEFDYDNAGNLLKDDKARYEYDAFNRNIKVETFSGDIQINRYDGEGLRHEMEENGKLFTFIFRGTEIVSEESKEDKIRYIRTGELLASDAESARTYYHYASDEMGSITHVVAGEEKESGNHAGEGITGSVLNRYEYDAWGNLTTCEEKIKSCFKYNGQQYDQVSGQYYLRARYYNPVIGRFTQEDIYRGDGLNLYAYCKNNPVYYVDPSGHNVCPKAVERISNEISENRASQADRDKLSNHLQEKINAGENLTGAEKRAAEQLGIDTSKGNTTSSANSNASDGYIHRGMKEDNGKPAAGDSARTLGVRPDIDIPVDANGMVYPNTGGMSAAPSAEALPTHRKPPEFGGTGKDPVWKININDLGPDLTYVPDSPQHGTVQPTRPMTLDDYQKALANTNANWEKEECP